MIFEDFARDCVRLAGQADNPQRLPWSIFVFSGDTAQTPGRKQLATVPDLHDFEAAYDVGWAK